MKKYCFTPLSVSDLADVKNHYGSFTFDTVSSFEKNRDFFDAKKNNKVDVIYVYSKVLHSREEYGEILSGNVLVTNDGIFGINAGEEFVKIPGGSVIYFFRSARMPQTFRAFLERYAKQYFNIEVIFTVSHDCPSLFSTKCHGLIYNGPNDSPPSLVPYICTPADLIYLASFIRKSGLFLDEIIIKKGGYSSGKGVQIFSTHSDLLTEITPFLQESLDHDYIIMQLLDTTDLEYRVLWAKDVLNTVSIVNLFGKERRPGNILHNIDQGNILRKLDLHMLPSTLQVKIQTYCASLPERHGGLDVLETKDGKYYFTENNIMTGYLAEPEQRYFAKEWLDTLASCYQQIQ